MLMWSQFIAFNHPLAEIAKGLYSLDKRRAYHNWDHILQNYSNAAKLGIEWNIELDVANMFHDVVYDEFPNKEKRSAELFELIYNVLDSDHKKEINLAKVKQYILSTETHSNLDVLDDSLIKMDLCDLTDPVLTEANYKKIITENMWLYGISVEFAHKGSYLFMDKFRDIIASNAYKFYTGDNPLKDVFYSKVYGGIEQTMEYSIEYLKNCESLK